MECIIPNPALTTALGAILRPLAHKAAQNDGDAPKAGGTPCDVPDWIPLVPAGPSLSGVDGRVFQMDDAQCRRRSSFRLKG